MENQTSEETQEETSTEPEKETQEETSEETSEETVEKETSKTSETVNYEDKFKASQKEAIRLKKENDGLRKNKKPSNPTGVDVAEIVEIQAATKDLSSEEITFLQTQAKATGKSLSETRKDENFILWQKAYKDKVEKENSPEPSTKQGASGQDKPLAQMTSDEKEKWLVERGFIKPARKPRPLT